MLQQRAAYIKKVTFSHFSRKAYAAFLSLKKEVKIAALKVDLCRQALLKNDILKFAQILLSSFSTNEEECELELIENLELQLQTIPAEVNELAHHFQKTDIKIPIRVGQLPGTDFFIYKH